MPRRSSGPRRIPRFRWTWTRPGTPPKKAKAETDESSSRSTGRRGRGGTTWRERRRDCGDGFGPVRQPPIASSTRLYRPRLLARSMRDWAVGVRAADYLRKIDGQLLPQKLNTRRLLNGYTVIDSMKAITTLDASDYLRIYGSTSERALFFTGVKYGRSPMIAIKAHPLKPAMVVYVQPENIDELAVKLAELDNILLARTELDQGELISRLERIA